MEPLWLILTILGALLLSSSMSEGKEDKPRPFRWIGGFIGLVMLIVGLIGIGGVFTTL